MSSSIANCLFVIILFHLTVLCLSQIYEEDRINCDEDAKAVFDEIQNQSTDLVKKARIDCLKSVSNVTADVARALEIACNVDNREEMQRKFNECEKNATKVGQNMKKHKVDGINKASGMIHNVAEKKKVILNKENEKKDADETSVEKIALKKLKIGGGGGERWRGETKPREILVGVKKHFNPFDPRVYLS